MSSDIERRASHWENVGKPLLKGMVSIHEPGEDPCTCEGWSHPVQKYSMGVRINFEKGMSCAQCGKKLSSAGVAWFGEGLK